MCSRYSSIFRFLCWKIFSDAQNFELRLRHSFLCCNEFWLLHWTDNYLVGNWTSFLARGKRSLIHHKPVGVNIQRVVAWTPKKWCLVGPFEPCTNLKSSYWQCIGSPYFITNLISIQCATQNSLKNDHANFSILSLKIHAMSDLCI